MKPASGDLDSGIEHPVGNPPTARREHGRDDASGPAIGRLLPSAAVVDPHNPRLPNLSPDPRHRSPGQV